MYTQVIAEPVPIQRTSSQTFSGRALELLCLEVFGIDTRTIRLTPEQLGFLAYLYPNDDPEDALIQLLESARNRAIHKVEQQVKVLRPSQEEAEGQEGIRISS